VLYLPLFAELLRDKTKTAILYLNQFSNTISCMLETLLGNQNVEKRIVEMMVADYAWEQVIYDLVAAEGLDPWNLDLAALSSSFLSYMNKIKELDFRIPAKYVIISSVILRMKSDSMKLLGVPGEETDTSLEGDYLDQPQQPPFTINGMDFSLLNFRERRRPTKQVMVTDLISALKRVMDTNERKELRFAAAKEKIKISADSIIERISKVYEKINSLMTKIKAEEVPFSNIVEAWDRKSIVNAFLPILHLDNEKKINCRQEEFFEEIYIKKAESNNHEIISQNQNGLNEIEKVKRKKYAK